LNILKIPRTMSLREAGDTAFLICMRDEMTIYRGFSSPIQAGTHVNLFRDSPRSPRDLDELIHLVADCWFFRSFGIRARSSCLICSTVIKQAENYTGTTGKVMLIAPCPPCKIIYSVKVRDMSSIENVILNPFDTGAINDWLAAKCYKCVDDPNLINPEHKGEVMIDCDSFVATDTDS